MKKVSASSTSPKKGGNILVAFFSRPGNNYVNGKIENLPVGNTEVVAEMVREETGGSLFRIESVKAYPADYHETTEAAQREMHANARPKLTSHLENMASFDTVILGYPNWWGTMPMPVFTFLEEYGLSGKKIAPFCTHEGSGLGRSLSDIKKSCPSSAILEGLAIRGGDASNAREKVVGWLYKIGIKE